ncbi:hypothetical protein W02_36950 [Nitrospira sp. KM1]|uniref:PIN domain-containing protein n=1 Tax=Nitrospira sp. KM1 TaxID=1936990 RepID=UPI0013A784FF|nr:PIN domain-containing protein [Nitrospira sp. KM1]BCA56555.1 hypothetical protein W02_36950 [Nitrospira sp. KM1]
MHQVLVIGKSFPAYVAGVKGNLVPDAYLAALAIESGSEWITTDRDYYRFPGLRVRHPFKESSSWRPSS